MDLGGEWTEDEETVILTALTYRGHGLEHLRRRFSSLQGGGNHMAKSRRQNRSDMAVNDLRLKASRYIYITNAECEAHIALFCNASQAQYPMRHS